ncbi:MAG: type I-D CRISPR-associated protein Cas5/Csc1 [Methanofollis sp.]|nr:type I-D CRISPR-associated protein Cas5/Csc1 [Methanofollis sp.]
MATTVAPRPTAAGQGVHGVQVYEGVLELMGELFFATLEPGNRYVTKPLILNTALYYALGYARGSYVNWASGRRSKRQQPTYLEDTAGLADEIYVSVARPVTPLRFTTENANARGDEYVQRNQPAKQMNSPTGKIGTRKQIQPGAKFRFFVLAFDGAVPDLPTYVRVGKKRTKALIKWNLLPVRRHTGRFMMNHPVLVDDLAHMPIGDIRFSRMVPFDVIEHGRFEGAYYAFTCTDGEKVCLPADLQFLRRWRA